MQLRLGYVWGEKGFHLGPSEYRHTFAPAVESLRLNGVEMDIHIKTHPRFLDDWVDILVRTVFCVSFSHIMFDLGLLRAPFL